MKNLLRSFFTLLIICTFTHANGQDQSVKLGIGSTAPELRVSWLKGTPVTSFSGDKLYVVEFWATWCGPCKAAMPHLSELAKRYEGKVVFIGVDVWEKGFQTKSYDSFTPMLKEFVESMGDKMAYNVAMDNNDLYMAKNWMEASGQQGIPASFIIKGGQIVWIGHPHVIEKTIDEILAGTYNMTAFAEKFNADRKKSMEKTEPLIKLMKSVEESVKAKDYRKALNDIENALVTIDPVFKLAVNNLKFTTLLQYNAQDGLKFAQEWAKEYPGAKGSIAMGIVALDGLDKKAYLLAIDYLNEMLSQGAVKPAVHHLIAQCYAKMKDFNGAINSEKQAIETAKAAIAAGEYQGTINNSTIKEYETALAGYKAQSGEFTDKS